MTDTIRVSSMTGFARAGGSSGAAGWSWEIKSVNGRALDIRCRLPQGLERLDPAVRGRVAARLKRGNVTVGLRLSQAPDAAAMRVNRAWLDELIVLAAEYRANEGIAPPRLDGMLALRGVIEAAEQPEDGADSGQDDAAMLETLDAALAELVHERRPDARLVGHQPVGPGVDLDQLFFRRQPVLTELANTRCDLPAYACHTNRIELVQIDCGDRQEPEPLQQRVGVVLGLSENPLVEGQPRQLPVDETLARPG